MHRTSMIKEPLADRVFLATLYLIMTIVLLIVLYPLVYIVSS